MHSCIDIQMYHALSLGKKETALYMYTMSDNIHVSCSATMGDYLNHNIDYQRLCCLREAKFCLIKIELK